MFSSKSRNNARSVSGQPLNLFVETLVVTDESIYSKHQALSGSTDSNVVFQHMRIYYAHSIHGVSLSMYKT